MSTYKARQKALRSSTHKFLATSALTAVGLATMSIPAAHAQNVAADALPQGAEVTRGSASYDYSQPNTLTIEQHAALTSAEYKGGFNIGRNAAVIMLQEGGDIFVHIDKSDNTSYIEGFFSGSGSNYVLNKNGVIITGTARIDMNSFVASTAASLDLDKLEDGQAVFTDFGDGAIVIEEGARVTVAEAGLAAFVSPFVSNAGVINAKMGTVAIGAGETVTLDLYGDGLVELAVDGELEDALIENTGTISAEGGKVQISARAAKDAVDNIINVDGIVTASSASVQGGKIVLSGGNSGTVSVKGTVDASGTDGGSIDVTGENIEIADTAELKADAGQNGDGGDVKIIASDKAIFRGSASARGGSESGKGGFVETSGHGYIDVAGATVDTRAADGTKGKWLIDPTDITIIDDNGANPGNTVAGDTSTIGWVQILDALNMSNLTIATTSAGAGTGNITFDDAGGYSLHTGTASSTLEFIADNDIIVNQNINLGDVGTTVFNAAADIIFNANFITSDNTVDATTSGNFEAHAGNDIFVNAGATVGVYTGAGNVTLDAANGNGGLSAIEIDGTVQADTGKAILNATNYFVEVNATGSVITNGGDLEVNSNHGFDIDNGGTVALGSGDAAFNTPLVQLGDDIVTTGTITGTATTVVVENDDAEIQDGVDIVNAGGTVNVAAGTYVEQVVIDKNLTLSGANAGVNPNTGVRGAETIIQSPASLTEFYTTSADNYPVVYVHDASNVVIDGIEVDGAKQGAGNYRFQGIGFYNAGGEIKNSIVHGTTNNPLNGSQHGNAIYAYNDTGTNTLDVTDNYIYDFQKNGITLNGTGLAGTVSGNVVEGSGILSSDNGDPAQNGIQIGFGANATVEDNEISNIGYADNNGDPVWAASSILVYDAGNDVNIKNNTVNGTGVDLGVGVYFTDNVEVTGNEITGSGVGVDAYEAQNIAISGNTFTESGLPDNANHVQVENSTYAGGGDIIDVWNDNTFVGRATVTDSDVNVDSDRIGVTIQGAIDDSNAGANVYVNAATYNENVDIDKSLILNGARAGENAIGRTGEESVIEGYIRLAGFLDGVTIDGFTIVNQGENVPAFGGQASIAVNTGSQNIEILNNKFDGNGEAASFGVVTSIGGVENVHIQHNDFTDLNGGIYVNPNAVNVDIQQNRFRNNNVGAVVEDGDGDTKVRGNRFINNNEGVVLFGDVDTFRNNRFRGDTQQHIAYLSAAAADLLVDESTGNRFWSDGEYKFTDDMSNDELFALEDQVLHKMDDAGNGLVVFKEGELFVTQSSGSIQRGVDASDAGGILWVGDGTFNENVNVWKALTINGDGTVATTIIDGTGLDGHGITVAADNVSLNGMIIENFNGPYYFASGIGVETDVNNLSMNDIVSRNNKFAGLYVENAASVDGLDVDDSHFDNNVFGWYFQKDDNSLANTSTVTNVTVNGTSFDSNSRKGLYLEKLEKASFTTIQVLNSGTDVGSPFENAGVDINLKNGDYENIAFDGLTVSGSGVNTAGGKRGSGVIIKARNDGGTYSLSPASLTNVTITNANIDAAGDVGLAFGNNINGGSVTNSTISGPEAVAIYGGASNLTIGGGNNINAHGEGLSSIGLNFGVGISGGSGNIVDDNVITADGIGVAVQDSAGSRVRNNDIDAAQKGVYADNAQDIQVNDNIITGAAQVGVHVKNSDGTGYGGGQNDVDIWSNVITNAAGATGVLIENSNYATVGWHPTNPFANANTGGNTITGGENGVVVTGSNNAYIAHNDISGQNGGDGPASGDGIYVKDSAGVTIFDNDIHDVEDEGIQGDNTDNITVADNELENIGNVGIAIIRNSDNQTITANQITNTGYSGIRSSGAGTLNISGNTITNSGHKSGATNVQNDGIHVDRLLGGGFASGSVSGNTISNAAHAGIEIENIDTGLTVSDNTVSDAQVGIYNNGSDDTVIDSNTVSNVGTGILVNPSLGVDVIGNIIHSVTNDAIKILNSDGALVSGNWIGYSDAGVTVAGLNNIGGDGVFVDNSDNVEIKGNTITETHSTGTDKGSGIQVINSSGTAIGGDGADGNTITNSGWDGIRLQNNGNITVENNSIDTTERVGIWGGNIATASILDNIVQNDGLGGYGSIHADGGSNWTVTGNDVDGGDFGIRLNSTGGTNLIDDNDVDNVTADGIHASSVSNLTVDANFIGKDGGNVGGDGIEIQSSNGAKITANEINDTGDNGIYVNASNDVEIGGASSGLGNTITRAGAHGILVTGGENALIQYNTVKGTDTTSIMGSFFGIPYVKNANNGVAGAQLDGIHVENNDGVDILDNTIAAGQKKLIHLLFGASGGNGANGHGIFVSSSDNAVIDQNTVSADDLGNGLGAGLNGIHVENSDTLTVGGLTPLLNGNRIFSTGNDGIHIDGSSGAFVLNNIVSGANLFGFGGEIGDDGIDLNNVTGSVVAGNIITDTDDDGIEFTNGALSAIVLNLISDAGDDGIDIRNAGLLLVAANEINDANENGIQTDGTFGLLIAGNTIDDSGEDGIHADNGILTIINGNDISDSDDDGIDISTTVLANVEGNTVDDSGHNGIQAENLLFASIAGNTVTDSGFNGIDLRDSGFVTINGNSVSGSGFNGIFVDPSFGIDISGNTVFLSGNDGIHVDDVIGLNIENNIVGLSADDGIDVNNVFGFNIADNIVGGSADNGIELRNSTFGTVDGNFVIFSGGDGIEADDLSNASIVDNTVLFSADDGIDVDNSAGIDILRNNIAFAGDNGIQVDDSAFADIRRNRIAFVANNGIDVDDSFAVDILRNRVSFAGNDGIHVDDSAFADIRRNRVSDVGDDGIDVDDSFGVDITRNRVSDVDDNGIEVSDSAFADIRRNRITRVGDSGIDVDNSFGVDITRNRISFAGDNGIEVDDSAFADIRRNRIAFVADNGIDVDDSFAVDIQRNLVAFTGNDGIHVEDSNFADIEQNLVTFAGDDGIDVEDSWLTEIRDNGVFFVADNGVEFQSGGMSTIDDNTIAFAGGNGIYVNPSYFMAITNNTIDFTGDDGIDINDGAFFLIANNEIGANGGFIGDDGIDIDGTSNVTIENNIIQNADESGIELTDTDLVNILFNSISDNGDYGLWVRGAGNGSVVLSGNTFTDNPTGARFESGAIDISGDANSFINTNPLGTPIGMQFDEVGAPGSLTIVGNTLGNTIFSGFGNLGSYYVRIEDGTLLDTVTADPIVINGLNASFDGFIPASVGGILTLAQLNFIESRLHDADDAVVNGRGQIFVGSTITLDVEEFFNQFGFFGPGISGFNLTFLGLPPVTLPTGNLNNIQTFAGPGDLNNISPAAGGEDDAESLADIEPAAGAEETSCWTDIWNAPVNGGVNFNYSGDPTESLNAAASCGS